MGYDLRAQHAGGASTAGAAGVDILLLAAVNHLTAVVVLRGDVNIVPRQQFVEQIAADEAEVTGEDEVVVGWGGIVCGEVAGYGAGCGGGKCQGYTIK